MTFPTRAAPTFASSFLKCPLYYWTNYLYTFTEYNTVHWHHECPVHFYSLFSFNCYRGQLWCCQRVGQDFIEYKHNFYNNLKLLIFSYPCMSGDFFIRLWEKASNICYPSLHKIFLRLSLHRLTVCQSEHPWFLHQGHSKHHMIFVWVCTFPHSELSKEKCASPKMDTQGTIPGVCLHQCNIVASTQNR